MANFFSTDPDENWSYGTVTHLENDLGASPGDNITTEIEGIGDNEQLEIPANTYQVDEVTNTGRQTSSIKGLDGGPVLEQTANYGHESFHFKGDEILLENFTLKRDATSELGGLDLDMNGAWVARDITMDGTQSSGGNAFRIAANGGQDCLVENCVANPVDAYGTGDRNAQGFFGPSSHSGRIEIRDCEIGYAGDNGAYVSPPGGNGGGSFHFVRGYFENNNLSHIRCGSDNCSAEGVVVYGYETPPGKFGTGDTLNVRGFWMRRAGQDMTINNCDVTMESGVGWTRGILVAEDAVTNVTDSRVKDNEAGANTLQDDTDATGDTSLGDMTGSGCHLTGGDITVNADSSIVECREDVDGGCNEPRTTARTGVPADGAPGYTLRSSAIGLIQTTASGLVGHGLTTTIVEDWEDSTEPSSEWSGDTGQFSAQSTVVDAGSQALELNSSVNDGTIYKIVSTSGLPNYFPKGNIAEYFVRSDVANDGTNRFRAYPAFGASGTSTQYNVFCAFDNQPSGSLKLQVQDGGAPTQLDGVSMAWSADTWYRIEITWDDGTLGGADNDITADVYQMGSSTIEASVSANDSTHSGKDGVGFAGVSEVDGSTVYCGNYQIQ